MNVVDPSDANPNKRFSILVKITKLDASNDMIGRLNLDIFPQEWLLLNVIDVRVKLILCANGEEKFTVSLDPSLFLCKVRVSPDVA